MPRGNGGVIGPANIPTTASAKGVWSLVEQMIAKSQGIWPSSILPDPYFDYTTLLLPGNGTNGAQNNTFLDSSTNNFTITRNGNTTQGTFSPFSQTGWGNYFNGSSNLETPDAAALHLGTGDFTVEGWVYATTTSVSRPIYFHNYGGYELGIFINSGNNLVAASYGASTNFVITSSSTVSANFWFHFALVRSGSGSNNVVLYIDGVSRGTATYTGTMTNGFAGGYRIARDYSSTYLTGYISNLRVVKGRAVYTSAFTPPTSPLTRTTGGTNPPQGTECSLLTCQSNRFLDSNGVNIPASSPLTITANGSPSVQAFSPFNPSASWSAATYGGSGYFDGNVDYLTVPNNTAINIGTSDFQLSFWVYPTAFNTTNTIFYKASGNLVVNLLSTGQVGIAQYGAGGYAITTTNSTTLNAWAYVVVSRVSNVTKVFVNGVEGGSTGDSSNYTSTNDLLVGIDTGNTAQRYTGYLADFRLVKGSGVTSVTVPTAPLTAITNTSLLLNFTNAGIYDATSKNDLETVDGAKISTAISAKWGSGSMYFDGSGDYLNMQSSAQTQNYVFGTGDFTIETWAYFTSVASGTLFEFRPNTNGAYPLLYFSSSGVLTYFANSAAQINSSTLSTGQWYHIALARSGTSTKLFVNGTQSGSTYTDSTNYSCRTGGPLIGVTYGLSFDQLNGYLQDFRVTKGYARYTTNFTAPTAAFPTL
jgi:hypothetical protein